MPEHSVGRVHGFHGNFLVVVRGVFLRGTSFGDHLPQYGILAGFAALGLVVGVRRFRAMVGG